MPCSYLVKRERPRLATLRSRGITFVGGHISYGHYAQQVDDAGPDGLHVITFVRDPVQLTLSLFQHCARRRYIWRAVTEFFDIELASHGVAADSPEAIRLFLARCDELTGFSGDNLQVRFAVDKMTGPLDTSDLEAAKRNLAAMDVVGITERFEDSLRLIAIRFGWAALEFGHYGAALENIRSNYGAELLREIEARCAFDRALFAWANDRFEADLADARASCTYRKESEPVITFTPNTPKRFSIRWIRQWVAVAGTWTRDDWRWWWEIKATMLGNRIWQHWQLAWHVRGAKEELHVLRTVLFDWRSYPRSLR